MAVSSEKRRAAFWEMLASTSLAGLIVLGSRTLNHFDAALVGYTFATLFAAFGITIGTRCGSSVHRRGLIMWG